MDTMPYGWIYELMLFDGRRYIGQTTYNPYQYYNNTYVIRKGRGRPYLCNAIKYYGINCFNFKIIDIGWDYNDLDYKEKFYVELYGCRNVEFGFNIKEGGIHGKHNEKTKNKLRELNIGKRMGINNHKTKIITIKNYETGEIIVGCTTDLYKQCDIGKHILRTGRCNNWELIKIETKEGVELPIKSKGLRLCEQKGLNHPKSKLVRIKDTITGIEYEGCMAELSRQLGFNKKHMYGSRRSSKGFIVLSSKDT